MHTVYGIGIRKGGQGKSTTVSTLARLCALYGARVLVIDLAQPGSTSASLRDLWPTAEHVDFASVLLACRGIPAGQAPDATKARALLAEAGLPVVLASQPSWSGGVIRIFPWDDLLGDGAAFLQSERVLEGLIAALADDTDIVLIDLPAESGPLLVTALMATNRLLMPMVPEAPSLEGVDAMLRLMTRLRDAGHPIELAGILMTRCEPKNKRVFDIWQTLVQADEVEGELLSRKLLPFAVKQIEFYEQAFRYGEAIWDRTGNPSHWAAYVLLTEWLLRDAGLAQLAANRRGPSLLPPDTKIFDLSALVLDDPEIPLADFERAHLARANGHTP
ncbi:MAG TPA: ParA family protein [Ktedonobacterales bacterium]|nr:ParA family protein [Ktedonobacterales bacterium]